MRRPAVALTAAAALVASTAGFGAPAVAAAVSRPPGTGAHRVLAQTAKPHASGDSFGNTFTPLAPHRVFASTSIHAGTAHRFIVTGRHGVPSTGVAGIVMDVTAHDATRRASLVTYASGVAAPHIISLSLNPEHNVTNLVIAPVSTAGAVSIAVSAGKADVSGTVIGYERPVAPSGIGSSLVPLTPTQLLPAKGAAIQAGKVRVVPVVGRHGVQASGTTAVIAELTITGGAKSGTFTAYPGGQVAPSRSTGSYAAHTSSSQLVVVRPGATGTVDLTVSRGTVRARLQLLGYAAGFGTPATASSTDAPLRGRRVLNTSSNVGGHPAPLTPASGASVPVLGHAGVPKSGVAGVWLDVTTRRAARAATVRVSSGGRAASLTVPVTTHGANTTLVLARPAGDGTVHLGIGDGSDEVTVDVTGYLTTDPTPVPVTALDVTAPSSSSARLTWTPPTQSNLAAIKVRRSAGATAPTSLTDGTAVATLSPHASSITDSGLQSQSTYSYSVFTLDDIGRVSQPAQAHTETSKAPTTSPITGVTATNSGAHSIALAWTDPTGDDFTGVMVRRNAGTVPPTSASDGDLVANTDASTSHLTDSGLTAGGVYSYALFARYGALNSSSVTVLGATAGPAAGSPAPVTNLHAAPAALAVNLSWTPNPSTRYVIVRRSVGAAAPATPSDGDPVTVIDEFQQYPDVSSYTDSGLTANAMYSYSLFTVDNLDTYSAAASATTSVQGAHGVARVCGYITGHQQWSPTAASVYELTCPVFVRPGASLSLAPDTIVKSGTNGSLTVAGTLTANGTSAEPITFTSLADDSVGGDTNNDGNLTAPAPGDWPGFQPIDGGESNLVTDSNLTLDHVAIDYAGGTDGYAVWEQGLTTITNSAVAHCLGTALRVDSMNQDSPDLESNTIDHCDAGIYVGVTTSPIVRNNSVTNVAGSAIVIAGANLYPAKLSGNTGSNDGAPTMSVQGVLAADLTLPTAGLPWTFGVATIAPSVALTVSAGATVPAIEIIVQGTLHAVGTAAQPISLQPSPTSPDPYGQQIVADPITGVSPPTVDVEHTTAGAIGSSGPTHLSLINDSLTGVYVATTDGSAVDVEDNTITTPNQSGITLASAAAGARIENNTITGATKVAMLVTGDDIAPATLVGNTGAGNKLNVIDVNGTLTGDFALPAAGFPWVVYGSQDCAFVVMTYVCGSGLIVAPTATLTLNPGAVIKADDNTSSTDPDSPIDSVLVEGRLIGQGTAGSPATITSFRDDSVGGDTNNDGLATQPVAGDWLGILTNRVGSTVPVVHLDHTNVSYTDLIDLSGDVELTNDEISHTGIATENFYPAANPAAITVGDLQGDTADIETVTVNDAAGPGVQVGTTNASTPPILKNNVVTNSKAAAIVMTGTALDLSEVSGNVGIGDAPTAMQIEGTLSTDLTLPLDGLPVVVGDPTCRLPQTCGNLVIPSGLTMTLQAGAVLKFTGGAPIDTAAPTTPDVVVEGSFVSQGTTADPVVMTSINDDSAGGDTNGDGSATKPTAGRWVLSAISQPGSPAPRIDLENTVSRYAQTIAAAGVANLTIHGGSISHTSLPAVSAGLAAGGSIDVENTKVSHVTGDGMDVVDGSTRAADSPTIENNVVTNTTGNAIAVSAGDLDASRLTGNTGSGNAANAIGVSGTLLGDATLPVPGLSWVISPTLPAYPYYISGVGFSTTSLTIPPGTTLTIQAGDRLWFAPTGGGDGYGPSIDVQGHLVINGTATQPVVLTSLSDASSAPPTTGSVVAPKPSDWRGIVVDPQANQLPPSAMIANATISYAWTALAVPSGSATVTGTITHDTLGVTGPPTAAGGTCPSGSVTATPVDWGTPTGPAPYGTGPAVSGCVTVQPWVGE